MWRGIFILQHKRSKDWKLPAATIHSKEREALCPWHTLQKPAPENWRRFLARAGAEFFWRQILESDRTCSISRQNLATTWPKYWFVIGQCSMLLLFSFVGVVNFVCIFDYWNYLTYSVGWPLFWGYFCLLCMSFSHPCKWLGMLLK